MILPCKRPSRVCSVLRLLEPRDTHDNVSSYTRAMIDQVSPHRYATTRHGLVRFDDANSAIIRLKTESVLSVVAIRADCHVFLNFTPIDNSISYLYLFVPIPRSNVFVSVASVTFTVGHFRRREIGILFHLRPNRPQRPWLTFQDL